MPIETTLGLLGILWWLDSSHDRLPAGVQVRFLGHQLSNLLTPIMTQPGRAGKFTKTQKEGADGIPAPSCVFWWALQDSNLRPTDYESAALTN